MVTDLRSYDVIGFGDEVPGVLAVISAAREYRRRTKRYPRVLLMCKGNLQEGIGGHLVRGGLAYLDRSQISQELQKSLNLDTFGSPAAIYKEFLQKSGVTAIALDPRKASAALKEMLLQAGVDLLSKVEIQSISKEGKKIASITTSQGAVYAGKQFIDATVNAELAQAAGVRKQQGFETFGLPNSELPVTLVFETQGLSARRLKELDYIYLKRFTNLADSESQKFLLYAAGKDAKLAEELRLEMLDTRGNLRTLWAGRDYIDVRSPALSVAYHSFRGRKLSFPETGVILDEGNIAILPNERLSWNALLFAVTASEAEALARSGSKPTANMQKEMLFLAAWLRSLGATSVTSASEVYIRHAGNVTGVVEPLTGAQMLLGGVPANEALATFSYHFDVRGGIPGIGEKANSLGWFKSLSFKQPTFNIGIRHALIKNVPNLAVVSPCSGFEGFASSVGRIVEFNAAVGQGVGIAAINAILNNKNLADVSNREVRQVLAQTGQLPIIFGFANNADGVLLAQFENLVSSDAIA
ncbi:MULTISPECIES: FAD-dependent oxidoreductase [unclassified Microcoleus]|uniref:FAD-dependent oxidoreductase n=1 Tax=unclassified Microcoleus TaxID=2642155 RepID=UPI002FD3507E